MTQHTHPNRLLAQIALAVLAIASAHAANFTWTGGAGNGTWSVGANWGGTAPTGVSTDNMTFTGNTQTSTVNDLTANATFGTISFTNNNTVGSAAAFNLSGNAITLGGDITATTSTTVIADTIANDLVLSSNATRTVTAAGNHTIALTGNISFTSNGTLSVNNSAALSGAGGSINFGAAGNGATLLLTNSNNMTFSRAINVSTANTAVFQVNNSTGVLTYNGTYTGTGLATNLFNLSGTGTGTGTSINDWQSDFGNGNNTATNLQKSGAGNWKISGAIKTGAGTLGVINGNLTVTNDTNNFTGTINVGGGGALHFTTIGNVGGGASSLGAPTTGANGLVTLGTNSGDGTLNYIGTGSSSNRTIKIGNAAASPGNATINSNGSGALVWTNSAFMPTQTGYNLNHTLTLGGNNTGNNEIQGAIIDQTAGSGKQSVIKADSGKWILSGNNTYTGGTTINSGTLIARGSSSLGNGSVTLNNANLTYAAASDAALSINGNLAITAGSSTVIGASVGSTTTSAQINVTGNATISNAAQVINLYGVSGVTHATGAVTLIHGGGSANSLNPATVPTLGLVYNNTDFTINTTGGDGGTSPFTRTAGDLKINLSAATAVTSAFWKGGLTGATTVWAASNGTTASNWATTSGGSVQALTPGSGANVTIDTSSGNTTSTTLGADMTIKSLTIANTNAGGLGLNADGYTLTIAPGASTSGITMNASVPASTIAANVKLGANQTWTNNSANALTVSGGISGSGNLTKAGSGTLIVSGTNTYNGTTTLNAGNLTLGQQNAVQNSTLTMAGGTLVFDSAVSGNAFTLGGLAASSSGAGFDIALQNNAGSPGAVALTVGNNSANTTYNGTLSGAGSLIKTGTGILTLNGNNTYSGVTTVSAGTLQFSAANNLGNGSATNTISLGGGTLQSTNGTYDLGANRSIALTAGSTLQANNGTLTVSGNVTGSSTLTLLGSVILTNANNSFSGLTIGTGGTAGTVQVDSIADSGVNQELGTSGNIQMGTGSGSGTLVLVGSSAAQSTNKTVSVGSGASTGGAFITNNNTNSANTLTFTAATFNVANSSSVNKTLTLGGSNAGNNTIQGGIVDNTTFKVLLTKADAGTWVLSGNNTYTGGTTVNAGTLKVNNTLGSGTGTGAVAINSGGILGGNGTISGAVTVNGTISPGNSPGTLNTGAATYNGGGSYVWEVNNAAGTKGGDPGYDYHNITGNLTIGSSSGTPFNVNVTGLNTTNVSGAVSNWNPNAFSQFTLATASAGIVSYSSDKFSVSTGNFTNNNSIGSGAFSVQKSGNNLVLVFNSAGGGSGTNGLVQGLGIYAADNASQSAYTGGNLNGQNGGFGYEAWSSNNISGFAGSFVGNSQINAGGANSATPSGNFINTTGAKAWGNFANTSNTSDNTRTITGGLAVGRTLALDFDNGYANGSSSQGISYRNSSGNNVFEFYYDASTGKYRYSDSSGTTTTTQGFSGDGLHTEFTQTSATGYTFTISGTGITSQTFTGSLINATGGTSIDRFRTFAFNSSGSDTNSDFNAFFNSPILVLPTWNGQSVGSGGGNFTTGTAWAAHSPVNGGSIAFDGTGSTVNNDSTTSVYNIAFNATGTLGNTNNTTNAGAYTLTGNALTINGGIDNNSTNLQTINNNLTLGASQTFNATNGALTMNGSVALGGKYLTVNATNATALNGAISGNGDIVKTGSGTLTLAGNNTFTGTGVSGQTYGQVFVTNGTVRAATNSALGTQVGGVSVDLGDSNPGQTGVTHYSNDVSLLANSGVTIANQIYVDTNTGGSTRTIGSDGTTGPVTFSGNMLLTGNATLTAAVGGNVTFSGSLGTGNFTTGGITKQGTGRVTLSGSNGFTGTTTVSAGTLELAKSGGQAIGATSSVTITTGGTLLLSQSNQINDAATITLNGGTFNTGGLSETVGTLTLSSNSTLDLAGASSLNFAASSGQTWSGTLSIWNWTSGTDHVYFGTSGTGLTGGQLNQVSFFSDSGTSFIGTAGFVSGSFGEITAVPEPGTIAAGLVIVGFIAWRERKRLASIVRRSTKSAVIS